MNEPCDPRDGRLKSGDPNENEITFINRHASELAQASTLPNFQLVTTELKAASEHLTKAVNKLRGYE